MTSQVTAGQVRKLSSVNVLAALSALASSASAQGIAVPGRDLLTYPVGLIAEAGAIPGMLGLGLFNPAACRQFATTPRWMT